MQKLISIVISSYNEEEGIYSFGTSLVNELDSTEDRAFEIIWVNDGSSDATQGVIHRITQIKSKNHINHVTIEFSKNFGHESAMIAGIDNAKGDAVICMDADGQHPASEIPKMIAAFDEGHDYVLMKREQRSDNGAIKKALSSMFYRVINALSEIKFQKNSSDFFLVSTSITEVIKTSYREKNRFLRGFIQSLGFSKTSLSFIAPDREFGTSHYSYKHLFRLALSAIFTFSFKPLRISIHFSILFILMTTSLVVYSLYQYVYGDIIPSGYTTLITLMSFSFASLFSILAVLLMYFEKLIDEMRQRPLYIIKSKKNHQNGQ